MFIYLNHFFRRLSIKHFSSFLFLIFAPAIRWSTMFTVFGVRQIFRVETQTRAGCIWRSNNVVFAFNLLAFRSLFGFEEQSELRCLKFQLSRVCVFKGYRFFLTGLYTVNIFFADFLDNICTLDLALVCKFSVFVKLLETSCQTLKFW